MPFADELIGTRTAADLAAAIKAAEPTLPLACLAAAPGSFAALALRERSDVLRDALLADLPGTYFSFSDVIRTAAAGPLPFTGWLIWPVTSAVAAKAVADGGNEAFDDALALLAGLTSRLTSEFALRTLLNANLDRALAAIQVWTGSEDEHIRRLASEGTRPFLPWSRRVPEILARPGATLPILEALHRDRSEYVRRSVANHLNDLGRQQPELAVATAAAWLQPLNGAGHKDAAPDSGTANTARLVRHGLRGLIKKGNPEALTLLGFPPARVLVTGPELDSTAVPFGGTVTFRAQISNPGPDPVRLAVDYVVHHRKANGTQTGKTFKLTSTTLAPGGEATVTRTHSFRAITTRRYYSGPHAIELQINGVQSGRTEFMLLPAD